MNLDAASNTNFEKGLTALSNFVFKNKWVLAFSVFILNCLLGLGLFSIVLNNDIENLFISKRSPTLRLQPYMKMLFPESSNSKFDPTSSVLKPHFAEFIVSPKKYQRLDEEELQLLSDMVANITIHSNCYGEVNLNYICEKNDSECYVEDTYKNADLRRRFYLRQDSEGMSSVSEQWMNKFVSKMSSMDFENISVVCQHSKSFLQELGEETFPDIPLFALSFTIYMMYMGFFLSGGDCRTKVVNLARIGLAITPGISIMAAWGILSSCGQHFTNSTGFMPYILLFHQANNALVSIYNLPEPSQHMLAKKRLQISIMKSFVPITMVTICYVASFVFGMVGSDFLASRIVCSYSAVTFIANYFNHQIFFNACLAIHEERIDHNRHFCTCQVLKTKMEAQMEGRSKGYQCCCTRPSALEPTSRHSHIEKLTQMFLSRAGSTSFFRAFLVVFYLAYLGFFVYYCTQFNVGILKEEFVSSKSYFNHFYQKENEVFKKDFYIYFVQTSNINTTGILESISRQKFVDESSVWLSNSINNINYLNLTNNSSETSKFNVFSTPNLTNFDVSEKINGIPFFYKLNIKTKNISSFNDIFELRKNLIGMSGLTENCHVLETRENKPENLNAVIYSPYFIYVDRLTRPLVEYGVILASHLGVGVILIACSCRHLLSVVNYVFWFLSIHVSAIGALSCLDVSMNQITFIGVLIGICYTQDVLIHSVYFFSKQAGFDRKSRSYDLLTSISTILFHTCLATFVGLFIVFAVNSKVFVVVMTMFMVFSGVSFFHAGFFIPVGLSVFGPRDEYLPHTNKLPTININSLVFKTDAGLNVNETIGSTSFENKSFDRIDELAPKKVPHYDFKF